MEEELRIATAAMNTLQLVQARSFYISVIQGAGKGSGIDSHSVPSFNFIPRGESRQTNVLE